MEKENTGDPRRERAIVVAQGTEKSISIQSYERLKGGKDVELIGYALSDGSREDLKPSRETSKAAAEAAAKTEGDKGETGSKSEGNIDEADYEAAVERAKGFEKDGEYEKAAEAFDAAGEIKRSGYISTRAKANRKVLEGETLLAEGKNAEALEALSYAKRNGIDVDRVNDAIAKATESDPS